MWFWKIVKIGFYTSGNILHCKPLTKVVPSSPVQQGWNALSLVSTVILVLLFFHLRCCLSYDFCSVSEIPCCFWDRFSNSDSVTAAFQTVFTQGFS
jgi:hypothetical protein